MFPSNKAFGAMAGVLTGPEESAATTVNSFGYDFVQSKERHIMKRKGTKDTCTESKAPCAVKEGSTLARKISVIGSDERLAISNGKFMGEKAEGQDMFKGRKRLKHRRCWQDCWQHQSRHQWEER
jgi:hypothetical protein